MAGDGRSCGSRFGQHGLSRADRGTSEHPQRDHRPQRQRDAGGCSHSSADQPGCEAKGRPTADSGNVRQHFHRHGVRHRRPCRHHRLLQHQGKRPDCADQRPEFNPGGYRRLLAQGVADASSFSQVRFFTNDFDTTTQGIDVVATYPVKMLGGDTTFTFAGNWNQTKVDAFNPDIIHPEKVRQLEEGLPEFRFSLTADHRQGPWRFLSRLHYYDGFVEFFIAGSGLPPTNASPRWLMDTEVSYTFQSGLTLAAGAENLFNTYPTENPNATILGNKYPVSSPYGFNGGFYYLGVSYAF